MRARSGPPERAVDSAPVTRRARDRLRRSVGPPGGLMCDVIYTDTVI